MEKNLYNEFINFFKTKGLYNEITFDYLRNNGEIIDYLDEERRPEIRCYCIIKNKILTGVWVCVPLIKDYQTLLINIYIYTHAIQLCKQIGRKYDPKNDTRTLPMLYERIYLQENPNSELEEYINTLDNYTKKHGPKEDQTSLGIQDKLLEYYNSKNPSFEKLHKKARKLSKKYQKSNR